MFICFSELGFRISGVFDKSGGPGWARGVSSPLIRLLMFMVDDAVLDS